MIFDYIVNMSAVDDSSNFSMCASVRRNKVFWELS